MTSDPNNMLEGPGKSQQSERTGADAETRCQRILLVEDNRADAVLLQDMLMRDARGQFELAWTTSLRETLDRVQRERFDAVLLDLSLPDSHGLATIRQFSAAAPAMPILVMTGLADEEIASEAIRCGAEDYLVKGQTDVRLIGRAIHYAIDRKRAEKWLKAAKDSAEHANRTKDHFLAVLSHELRTPLTPVVMGLSMLQDRTDLDPAVRETLEMVRRNVELEARLIDDLLDVSRIAQGKLELTRCAVELCTVIQRAVEVCKPDIEARGLHFGVDLGPAAPYWIEADASRLQQVLWNLLKNAIKFTPNGGCVGIHCRPHEQHVVVEVNDSGIGIEPEALSRIFNAFEQVDRSITQQFGGLGLGLAISKALVEMHGGQIAAHSEGRGKGASFRIQLPLTAPAGQAKAPAAVQPQEQGVRSLCILLVEDHGVTAKMLRMVLTSNGHAVETAGDIATALELADQHAFDLLLSDLGLPDGSGHDLMRRLRQRGQTFPGIALSGYGQVEDIQRSHEAGFAAHLTKPASREAVLTAIATVTAAGTLQPKGRIMDQTESTPFNLDKALASLGGQWGLFQEMVGFFFNEGMKLLTEIQAAAATRDMKAIERKAHRLKGTVLYLGAAAATEAVARVEVLARLVDVAGTACAVAAMEAELARLGAALRPYAPMPETVPATVDQGTTLE